ncbi:nucleotidyltransferase [Rummeliibacillus pycnus]|uniref:nucleotidyltransferase n=1 Tax=Rummeliibacillus pycnus TaxID=101070 RepID=UPI000C9BA9AE|nr:nucleotidyltransferase [Rummeliibacillus pycnus]
MIATGVIVEYNPFHNGHLYHIKQSREHTDADVMIAVMSGHFLQRGEPAFVDKWTRTKMALASGVDLVIELPYVYATAQASDFAKGGVLLLEALQCDFLSFGSEQGNIAPFLHTYSLLENENAMFQEEVQKLIKTGLSYPHALNTAYQKLIPNSGVTYADLTKPNNVLGYHYVETTQKYKTHVKPITIQRIQAGYHDTIRDSMTIASATGIRQAIQEQHSIQNVSSFLPDTSFHALTDWFEEYHHFASWELFWPYLRFSILRLTPAQIASYAEVTEGIEFLIIQAAKECRDFSSFMQKVKSKRYTWTRIQRMITHIFTNFTWQQLKSVNLPSYIRLLGMTQNGQRYLSERKKFFTLPIVSRVASSNDAMLLQDIHATDLYMLSLGKNKMGMDYKIPPIRY